MARECDAAYSCIACKEVGRRADHRMGGPYCETNKGFVKENIKERINNVRLPEAAAETNAVLVEGVTREENKDKEMESAKIPEIQMKGESNVEERSTGGDAEKVAR